MCHYSGVILCAVASQITGVSIVCSTVWSSTDQRKYQSSASLAFVKGIHLWPVDSPHKGPVTRKCFHLMTSSWWLASERYRVMHSIPSWPKRMKRNSSLTHVLLKFIDSHTFKPQDPQTIFHMSITDICNRNLSKSSNTKKWDGKELAVVPEKKPRNTLNTCGEWATKSTPFQQHFSLRVPHLSTQHILISVLSLDEVMFIMCLLNNTAPIFKTCINALCVGKDVKCSWSVAHKLLALFFECMYAALWCDDM